MTEDKDIEFLEEEEEFCELQRRTGSGMMAKKKSYVVNVNIKIPIEAYSTVVAEIKVREMLRFGLHNTDWILAGLIVEEDEDGRLD